MMTAIDTPARTGLMKAELLKADLLTDLPNSGFTLGIITLIITMVLLSVAVISGKTIRTPEGKGRPRLTKKGAVLSAATAVMFLTSVTSMAIYAIEDSRFLKANTGTVSEWLGSSYGLTASDEDLETMTKFIDGRGHTETHIFSSDEGLMVAKLVEGPDGVFGLVTVAEPVEQLD